MFRRSPNLEKSLLKELTKYLLQKYPEVSILSIGLNPDLFLNIVEVLLDTGFVISTNMQHREDKNSSHDKIPPSDVSKLMDHSSKFLNKSSFEIQKANDYYENLIYLRLYRREISNPRAKIKISLKKHKKDQSKAQVNIKKLMKKHIKSNNSYSVPKPEKVLQIPGITKLPVINSPRKQIKSKKMSCNNSPNIQLKRDISELSESINKSMRELEVYKRRNLYSIGSVGSRMSQLPDTSQTSMIYSGAGDISPYQKNISIYDMKSSPSGSENQRREIDFSNSISTNVGTNPSLNNSRILPQNFKRFFADRFQHTINDLNNSMKYVKNPNISKYISERSKVSRKMIPISKYPYKNRIPKVSNN